MRKTQRRRLFNLFAFALLAFAIYLTMFYKEKETLLNGQSHDSGKTPSQQSTALQTH